MLSSPREVKKVLMKKRVAYRAAGWRDDDEEGG